MIGGFEDRRPRVGGQEIACSAGGSGPALRLLRGLPQTRALRARVGPRLARRFTVAAAGPGGHGHSSKPGGAGHGTFRETGRGQVAPVSARGHDRFRLAGHGPGRAHRAPDGARRRDAASQPHADGHPVHPPPSRPPRPEGGGRLLSLVLPRRPAPLPEDTIRADPGRFFESCLPGRGGARLGRFDAGRLAGCRAAGRDPATMGATCDDCRAAILHDFDLDEADLGRRVACPALVVHRREGAPHGREGAMTRAGDLSAIRAPRRADTRAATLPGGHFFIDTHPGATAAALPDFLP